jgi:hypothetical protein
VAAIRRSSVPVKDDVRALEPVSAGFKIAVILSDGGTHGFETVDMKVNGASADGAASGHSDACDACACDERPEDQGAGTHGLHDLVLCDWIGQDGAFDVSAMLGTAVTELDLSSHAGQELALCLDIVDLRDVFEDDLVFGKNGGGHTRESGVFCSGDFDGTEKGIAAAHYKLVHFHSLRRFGVEISNGAGSRKSYPLNSARGS